MAFEFLNVVPSAGTDIEPDDVLSFDVRSEANFGQITLGIKFPRVAHSELAFASDPLVATDFLAPYTGSTVSLVVDPGFERWHFELRRGFKWPGNPTLVLYSEEVVMVAGPAGATGATGPAGPAGATGATGPAGAGESYSETFPATATWIVNHNFGRHPYSWAVETLGGLEIEVAVQHVSLNQSIVMFDVQTAGTARFT